MESRSAMIRTPDQRLRVFVSSTLGELQAERVAARRAIEELRLRPVLFEIGERPYPPRELYRAYLEQADVFVGIYWQRYGWVAPGEDASGLEDEYRLSAGLPRLVYIKTPSEPEPRLRPLLDRIAGDDVSYKRFAAADDLCQLLADDLAVLLTERFEQTASPRQTVPTVLEAEAAALPVPPAPLIGREREVREVGELLCGGTRLVVLTGPGDPGKLQVLVTSRAALRVRGEREYPVAPLVLPEHITEPEQLEQVPVVALFVDRARAARPDFVLTEQSAAAVAELCIRLDGLPLAIELAAAGMRLLSPRAILEHLAARPALLAGPRDLPQRQRTLESTIEWSYSRLDSEVQALLAQLGVFAGGCTVEAVAAVSRVEDHLQVLESLSALVDSSMLWKVDVAGYPRYQLLHTIRAYALERLDETGLGTEARAHHAGYYLRLAETTGRGLRTGARPTALTLLETERPNLTAALGWRLARRDFDGATRMAWAIGLPWFMTGPIGETVRWAEEAARAPETSRLARARALYLLGSMLHVQGRLDEAVRALEAGQELFHELGDLQGTADALALLGQTALFQQHFEHATTLLEESLAAERELGDELGSAFVLSHLALARLAQGDRQRAETLSDEAIDVGYRLARRLGAFLALFVLALAALGRGDRVHAEHVVSDRVRLALDRREWSYMASWLQMLPGLAAAGDDPERVARLLGAAEALRASSEDPGQPLFVHLAELAALTGQPVQGARKALDPRSWSRALDQGRAMAPQDMLDLALDDAGDPAVEGSRS